MSAWSPCEKQKPLGGSDLSCPSTALNMVVSHSYCGDLGDDRPFKQVNPGEGRDTM